MCLFLCARVCSCMYLYAWRCPVCVREGVCDAVRYLDHEEGWEDYYKYTPMVSQSAVGANRQLLWGGEGIYKHICIYMYVYVCVWM